jgi:myxalamid-type nonribosomal peptide synthetase MxaA
VTCLLRGDARKRLEESLVRQSLAHLAHRVRPLNGDLAQELDSDLARQVCTVIHAAADVSFVKDYAALRATNVEGTRAILDFCAKSGAGLHYISSLSVFRSVGDRRLTESEPLPENPPRRGGYAQSKWAAERLVHDFVAQGGDNKIHRLAMVISNTSLHTDYLTALQRGCKAIGAWPQIEVELPLIRVEVAAQSVIAAIGESFRIWHLQEPVCITMRQLADHIGNLEAVPPDQWLKRVERAIALAEDHPLAPYLEVLRGGFRDGLFSSDGPTGGKLDGTKSWNILREHEVEPTFDPAVILEALS